MNSMEGGPGGWFRRVWAAAFVVLAVGVIAHVTAWLLGPVVPILLTILAMGGLYWLVVDRFRRW